MKGCETFLLQMLKPAGEKYSILHSGTLKTLHINFQSEKGGRAINILHNLYKFCKQDTTAVLGGTSNEEKPH